jgi:hypothetical protein
LDRDNLRGRVALAGTLTATVQKVAHRPVGSAPVWAVHIDEPESLRLRGTLKVRWMDFKATDAPQPAAAFPGSTHVVGYAEGLPELWLNSSFEGLQGLLDDRKGRKGSDKGLHDLLRTGIARSAWLVMLADAVAGIRTDDDGEPDWPEAPWQAEILKAVLPEMAPAKPEREQLRLALDARQGLGGALDYFARAEAVVSDLVTSNKTLRAFAQTYRQENQE